MKPERLWVLVARKKSGEATIQELEELKELLASDTTSGYTAEVVEKIWQAPLVTIPENKVSDAVWQRIEGRTSGDKAAKLLRLFPIAKIVAAASVLLILSLTAVIIYNYYTDKSLLASTPGNMNQVTTQPGSKSKLELPDGTQVWLNANSKLTYANEHFGKNNREVILTGEAFFDVTKNEKVPFIIHTGPVNITVKGTAFNVKAYPKGETIETSLVRGLVEITTDEDPERKILLKPNEKIIIPVKKPGTTAFSKIITDSVGASLYTITKLKASEKEPAEIAWINPQLIFDNEPFEIIAPKLESWYNISIRFTDEELKKKRFTGVIEKETLKETLEAMQLSYHFYYQIKQNELWVGKK